MDLDGHKYLDCHLNEGRVPLGHQPASLGSRIRNGFSSASSYGYPDRFLYRLFKELSEWIAFERFSLFQSESSLLKSLLLPLTGQRIGVSSRWLHQEFQQYSPLLDITLVRPGSPCDILFFEVLDFDQDLSPVRPEHYKAEIKIGVLTRTWGRIPPKDCADLSVCDALAIGASVANGMPAGLVLSRRDFELRGETLPLYQTLACLETLRNLSRSGLSSRSWPRLEAPGIASQVGPFIAFAETLPSELLLRQGLLVRGRILYLSPQHTEHDMRRIQRCLEQVSGK